MDEQPVAPVNPNPEVPAPPSSPEPVAPQVTGSSEKELVLQLPAEWPGAFGLFKYSKSVVKRNLATAVILYVITIVISGITGRKYSFLTLIGELVSIIVSVALYQTYLAGMRDQTVSVGEAFKKTKPMVVVNFILMAMLAAVLLGISLMLLVVPFFFVLPRLLPASYFVLEGKGPVEALKASWAATKGHASKAWGIIGAQILMVLLCFTIIGIPVAIYLLFMYGAAGALFYAYVTRNQATEPAVATAPVQQPTPETPVAPQPPTVQ